MIVYEYTEIRTGLPNHLRRLVQQPLPFFLVIQAAKKKTVVTELREKRRHLPGMAERIDLPSDVWSSALAERVVQLPIGKNNKFQ